MNKIVSTDTDKIREKLTQAGQELQRSSDKLNIYPKWCKGCGICWELCPRNTLDVAKDGKVYIKDPASCTACMICELHCPDYAIIVIGSKAKK
ncbi:MAG: hypothetical protein Kow00108_21150 [Calditrichia bacterium]